MRAVGLGPAAGVLAIAITYGGMLGKVYAEILESTDTRPARACSKPAAAALAALVYGLLPSAAQELASYTVYRWECAMRASVVMGFVGAGGLGQLMDQSMKMLNGGEVATILLVFLVLVMLRRRAQFHAAQGARVNHAPEARRRVRRVRLLPELRPHRRADRSAVVASFAYLAIDFGTLFSADAAASMGRFAASFFPPDLVPDFLRKTAYGALQTLRRRDGRHAARGRRRRCCSHCPPPGATAAAAQRLSRFMLNFLRSVPELVWAALMVLAAGLGPFAGTLALALHTTGVLGRLFAEALENAPPQPEQACSKPAAAAYRPSSTARCR